MSYYQQLGLEKEPFSASPDPEFFYRADSHHTALKRLETAIRLRRGLSLIVGDVGVGKTTLARALLQLFRGEEDYMFSLMQDPGYRSEYQFLLHMARMWRIIPRFPSTRDLKDALQKFLFQKAVDENKTVILMIDDGQSLSLENLEALRMLLDHETDAGKLLQLVILAQAEILGRIGRIQHFTDRIALKYSLNPLDEAEVKQMIDFRLSRAGFRDEKVLFSDPAVRLITQHTQGYPRRITWLCHEAVRSLVSNDKAMVDERVIQGVIQRMDGYEKN
jgi:general secretion pathway protein A